MCVHHIFKPKLTKNYGEKLVSVAGIRMAWKTVVRTAYYGNKGHAQPCLRGFRHKINQSATSAISDCALDLQTPFFLLLISQNTSKRRWNRVARHSALAFRDAHGGFRRGNGPFITATSRRRLGGRHGFQHANKHTDRKLFLKEYDEKNGVTVRFTGSDAIARRDRARSQQQVNMS